MRAFVSVLELMVSGVKKDIGLEVEAEGREPGEVHVWQYLIVLGWLRQIFHDAEQVSEKNIPLESD